MTSRLKPAYYTGPENRTAVRYELSTSLSIIGVEVLVHNERYGHGSLINISSGGVAFKAHTPLNIGRDYLLVIRDIGAYPATIVRCFDVTNYGAKFLINDMRRRQLEQRLASLVDNSAVMTA